MKKIEIVMWYKCNCRCEFCASGAMRGDGFSTREVLGLLAEHRAGGARAVDFGGGEPTVRNDLPALAAAAKKLGFDSIGVKSNGMRFCYPDYARHCIESGVNEFSISLWGHNPEVHDRLAGRPGAFEMTEMGLKHLVDYGADVCVDFLVTTLTVDHIGEAIRKLARGAGVRKFRLWMFSIFGAGGAMTELLPEMSRAGKSAVETCSALRDDIDWIKTSHIMPCFLPGRESIYFNITELDLLIITPGSAFRGEQSPFETGTRVKACLKCRMRTTCAGPRKEYLDVFGEKGFSPVV